MHAIDWFCTLYKISNTELAKMLGVKQPQVGAWKSGARKIPEHHKETMYDIFYIPSGKEYLLEMKNLSDLERIEIELIHRQAQLQTYDYNTKDEPDNSMKLGVKRQLEIEVDLAKNQVLIEKVIKELKSNLHENFIRLFLSDQKKFNSQLQKVKDLAEELKNE